MSVPSSFKAATVSGAGAKHSVSDRSLPALQPGELAVRITATAINPVDWKIRDSGYFVRSWPTVLGSDAAGEVAALGPDVTGFAVGDRVFFQGILGSIDSTTFQQYAKIPAALVAKTPSNISDEQAAGISLATIAGAVGFYDKQTGAGLPAPWDEGGDRAGAGKAVVVLGGGSSVGQYAIQLARLSGFERIVTSASAAHREHLAGLGAHVVLDRSSAKVEDYVAALGGLPVTVVLDSVGVKDTQTLGVEILQSAGAQGGRVISVSQANPQAAELGASKEPKVSVSGVLGFGSAPHLRYISEPLMKHLGGEQGYIAQGRFTPNRVTVVEGGLAKLEDALDLNKKGVSAQKVVIRPSEE